MKSKSHFLHDLDLTSILEPADPNDKNYSATKVGSTGAQQQHQQGGRTQQQGGRTQQCIACSQKPELCQALPARTATPHASGMAGSRQPAAAARNALHRRRR